MSVDHAWFKMLRDRDRRAYNVEKKRLRERMFVVVECDYVSELRWHFVIQVMGMFVTNECFCVVFFGNVYGSVLTSRNVSCCVPSQMPFRNLWFANAMVGFSSIGGTVKIGIELVDGLFVR